MKPATNLLELYQNLTPSRFLTKEEAQFYVEVYDEKIKLLRLDLLMQASDKLTIYVSGQSGSGKTTALHFLPDEKINERFVVFPVLGNDLFDLHDIEVVDILLLLSNQLALGTPELEMRFKEELERIAQKYKGQYEEVVETDKSESRSKGGGLKGWLKGNPLSALLNVMGVEAKAFADYKLDRNKRQLVREVFNPSVKDILQLTNEIIRSYLQLKAPGKELLVIFHELNHIKNLDLIGELFIDNRNTLEGIQARKVITIPVSLIPDPEFGAEVFFLGTKTQASGLDQDANSQREAAENREILREIIEKRIAPGTALVTDTALELAIEQSGGNIRQLVSILFFATRKAVVTDMEHLAKAEVEEGMAEMRRILERSMITSSKIDLLYYVWTHKVLGGMDNKPLFRECALSNQILIYENKNIWYDINPLIRDTVDVYAERLAKDRAEKEE